MAYSSGGCRSIQLSYGRVLTHTKVKSEKFLLSRVAQVRPAGLEPAAYWFEASRSIQLSYGRALGPKIITRRVIFSRSASMRRIAAEPGMARLTSAISTV